MNCGSSKRSCPRPMPFRKVGRRVSSTKRRIAAPPCDHFTLVPAIMIGRFARGQDLERGHHVGAVGRLARRAAELREPGLVEVARRHQHVHRDLEERRAGDARGGVAHRQLDVLGDARGVVARVGPLRDGPDHVHVVHLLERAAAQVRERALAADHQDRAVRAPGVRDAGDAVGDAGAGGDDRAADLGGVQPAVRVGRVDGRLLVAHVDDLDALVERAVVDGHDVPAREREDAVDAGHLERARRELSTVGGHRVPPWGSRAG